MHHTNLLTNHCIAPHKQYAPLSLILPPIIHKSWSVQPHSSLANSTSLPINISDHSFASQQLPPAQLTMSGRNEDEDDYYEEQEEEDEVDYHEHQREYNNLRDEWNEREGWTNDDEIGQLERMRLATEQ